MTVLRMSFLCSLCSLLSFLLFEQTSYSEMIISEQTLPEDIVVEELYQAGSGLPVGKIHTVRGMVVVFHRSPEVGYRAKTGLPLYQGDIIRTRKEARILCRLIDGSKFAMAPETTISIVRGRYNSSKKTSESFLFLKEGSARFQVKRSTERTLQDFKIQTEKVFVEAKDADIIIKANSNVTEIYAFEESRLEVTGMADPEKAIILSGYQAAFVKNESGSPTVESVSQEEADAMMTEFRLAPESKLFASSAEKYGADNTTDEAAEPGWRVDEQLVSPEF